MPDVGVGGYASVPVRVAQIRRCLRDGWSRLIELAERDVPVWEPDPPATGERVLLCPITLPDGLPCPHRGAYRYRTRCPDPRPNSRWQREGEVISLAEAGLDIEEVALQVLPRTIHVSSGGVVYRQQEGEVLFALSQRVGESWWELPAGTVEGQEMLRQAAARELAEETGYRVELSAYVHYCYDTIFDEHPVLKVKHYFLAEAIEPTGWMDDTVTCQWCTHARALSQLAWEERFILRRALAQLMVEGKMK